MEKVHWNLEDFRKAMHFGIKLPYKLEVNEDQKYKTFDRGKRSYYFKNCSRKNEVNFYLNNAISVF